MTWKDNELKGRESRKNGKHPSVCRKVKAYHLDGTFYKEYHSVSAAARDVNGDQSAIQKVASKTPRIRRGITVYERTHKGFVWEWV